MRDDFNTGSNYRPHGYKTGPAFEGGEHFIEKEHNWIWVIIGVLLVLGLAVMVVK